MGETSYCIAGGCSCALPDARESEVYCLARILRRGRGKYMTRAWKGQKRGSSEGSTDNLQNSICRTAGELLMMRDGQVIIKPEAHNLC